MDRSAQAYSTSAFGGMLLALLLSMPAAAQLGEPIPHASYYVAVAAFYAGDYRDAERALRLEARRGVRTTQARWIDAICYHAMLGEVLYHQGRNPEALAELDQACQVLLAYPDWLLQVKFQQPPRPDAARARRAPPWGRSQRNATLGQFSQTEQVFIGELTPERVLRQGGAYQSPMFWRVNAVEIIRASALAIRRRSELLGPLAAHDPLMKELSTVLARGNLSPANHWSVAWIDLLRGLTQAGIGKFDEADMLLGRAVTIEQLDHPLTSVALLEQGRLAMKRGDSRRAAQLLAEAGYSAYYYENWDALTESVWLGWINHMASNSPGVYPPLEPLVAWAQLNRLQHIATKLRLADAESLLWLGQLEPAAAVLDEASRRIGEMSRGLPGVHLLYLQASLQLKRGQFEPGGQMLARAIAEQARVSLRNFQISRVSEMYDGRGISSRIAAELYAALLADPRPSDWTSDPLDAMAALQTHHDAAFDRWFIAALERKDNLLALDVAEQAKRRRFLAALPLGGRLLALETVLEAPETSLSREAVLERQQLMALFPEYRQLSAAGSTMYEALRTGPVLTADQADAKKLASQYDAWDKNVQRRQQLLMQLAARRLPMTIEFPPRRAPSELQESLAEGEAIIVFHASGGNLYGFLVTATDAHVWQCADGRKVRAGIGALLRALGNYGANHSLSAAELADESWRKPAADAFTAIFAGARLDLAKTKGLVIVPDDVLWYLPFDALIPEIANPDSTLADRVPIRYGPTAALAIRRPPAYRRQQHTGIVANDLSMGDESADTSALLSELEQASSGPLRIPSPLLGPNRVGGARLVAPLLDTLIVLDDVEGGPVSASALLPTQRGRGVAAQAGDVVSLLPSGGPERIVVTGFATAAEQGLKPARRPAARELRPGEEVFQTLCSLMAGGARTILLSRWRTGGRINLELVQEFVRELPNMPATEAWQRACLLARESPLDVRNEPRLKGLEASGELPTADHPFFWAGYLLVDTGPRLETPNDVDDPDNKDVPQGEKLPVKATAKDGKSAVNSIPATTTGSGAAGSGTGGSGSPGDQTAPADGAL